MKVKRKELLKALSDCSPGLSEKGLIEGADRFTFSGKHLVSYNDQICVTSPFKTDFTCSVPAKELLNIVSNIKTEEIELEHKKEKLILRSEKTKAGLATFDIEGIMEGLSSLKFSKKGTQWHPLPEDFLKGIEMCSFSVSKHALSGWLSCVFCKSGFLIGSDSIRISLYQLKEKLKENFLIQYHVIPNLLKFELQEYSLDESWIYFRNEEGFVFCCRRIIDEYPEVDDYFGIEGKRLKLPKELKEAVEGVSFFAEGDFLPDQFIKVSVTKGQIKCRGEKESGWVVKKVDFKYKGKTFSFSVNPKFFSQILDHSTVMICGEDRAEFISGPFKHILLFFEEEDSGE